MADWLSPVWYVQDWLYGADAGEEVQVMTELPQGLRKEIALCINEPLFKRLNIFHGFPEQVLAQIAAHMSPLQVCCPSLNGRKLSSLQDLDR